MWKIPTRDLSARRSSLSRAILVEVEISGKWGLLAAILQIKMIKNPVSLKSSCVFTALWNASLFKVYCERFLDNNVRGSPNGTQLRGVSGRVITAPYSCVPCRQSEHRGSRFSVHILCLPNKRVLSLRLTPRGIVDTSGRIANQEKKKQRLRAITKVCTAASRAHGAIRATGSDLIVSIYLIFQPYLFQSLRNVWIILVLSPCR